ncbi:MAG: hypothetical protein BGO05_19820 [Rhizobiales bacterium 63-7]|uniref:PepSY domain-containing protein n=1 Tax=Rhizobiaceae TaxID=82115 RepID=UPI00092A5268|nr:MULTISPECIES: PepSY domain-containing protein [Rhizobiaceae]MBN9034181.1 PepSY domain-containing protein [Hyphomicrobiales bacterium]MDG3580321.1 PepSY domain-containing protein [Rhizobium sp. YJ-22]OJU67562.1 MAG: hypothetical protein BGO05_19820 [Rhizobiales bacterium 63-7]
MRKYTALSAVLVALTLGGASATGALAAGQDDSKEYASLETAKVSLSDAIAAAEKAFGGKAVNAALDPEQNQPTYEVELMTANGSQTIAVNGLTGEAATTADTHDKGEHADGEDSE